MLLQAHHFDPEKSIIVMEYLTPHIILRKGLIAAIGTLVNICDYVVDMLSLHFSSLSAPRRAYVHFPCEDALLYE